VLRQFVVWFDKQFLLLSDVRANVFFAVPFCLAEWLIKHVQSQRIIALQLCTQLSRMSSALVQVNTSYATDLLSVHAIMLAALASSCRHSVSSFSAEGVHPQVGQGTIEIRQW